MLDFDSLTQAVLDGAQEGLGQAARIVVQRAKQRAPVRNIFGHQYQFRPKTAEELVADLKSLPTETLEDMMSTGPGRFATRWVGPKRVRPDWSERTWEAAQEHLALYEAGDETPLTRQGAHEIRSGRANFHTVREGGQVTVGGRLKGEIYSTKVHRMGSSAEVMVISPTKYAKYMEFGTRHNRAFPYLRPALEESRADIVARVSSAVANASKKGLGNAELEINVRL